MQMTISNPETRRQAIQRAMTEAAYQLRTARQRVESATNEVRYIALEALAHGFSEVQVAKEVGVDRMTIRKWAGKR